MFRLSPQLEHILKMSELSYLDIVNSIWLYVKLNRLQDEDNKSQILCNEELKQIF